MTALDLVPMAPFEEGPAVAVVTVPFSLPKKLEETR